MISEVKIMIGISMLMEVGWTKYKVKKQVQNLARVGELEEKNGVRS